MSSWKLCETVLCDFCESTLTKESILLLDCNDDSLGMDVCEYFLLDFREKIFLNVDLLPLAFPDPNDMDFLKYLSPENVFLLSWDTSRDALDNVRKISYFVSFLLRLATVLFLNTCRTILSNESKFPEACSTNHRTKQQ